ncbi:MAG: hypothetical protein QRY72_00710 [Candidatus Rhabdochlamydia sp.]
MMTATVVTSSQSQQISVTSSHKNPLSSDPKWVLGVVKWSLMSYCIGFIRTRGKKRMAARSAGYTAVAWVVYHLILQLFHHTTYRMATSYQEGGKKQITSSAARYESAIITLMIALLLKQKKILRWHSTTSLLVTLLPLLFKSSHSKIPFIVVVAALKKKKLNQKY